MPMENIHDVTVTQTARFTLQGKVVPAVVVRYFVADHGPFEDQYDEADVKANPQIIPEGYKHRIAMLAAAGVTLPTGAGY